MSGAHTEQLPRGALMLAGALVLFALSATTIARVAKLPPAASPVLMRAAEKIAPVKTRNLRFLDRTDGAVVIIDTDSGATAHVIAAGEKTGFIRGVMRGLARERRMHEISDQPPFALTLWKDGELSLTDSVTGRSIEINAFGTTNRASFAALLP